MKQILQSLKTGDIDLAQIPVPAVKTGHLLIKTSKTLISLGTERMLLNFGKAGWINKAKQQPDKVKQVLQKVKTDGIFATANTVFKKLDQPLALGYSNAGVVIEVGKGVTGFKPGDRVVSNGNHAEVVCIPQNLCAKIPESVDDESAAFTVVSAIALQGVRLVEPSLGESVAVLGLGLIGLLTCQILKANGCRVIGFDFDHKKVELARKYGATAWSIADGEDPVELATAFSGGYGVDAVIITASTTSNKPVEQAPQMCRKRGRVVLVGVTGLNISRDDFYKKEISFQVSCSYGPGRYESEYEQRGLDYPIGFVRWTEQRNFEAVLQLMADAKIVTKELVSETIDLDDAARAYDIVSASADALGIILNYPGNVDLAENQVRLPGSKGVEVVTSPEKAVVGVIGAGNYAGGILIPAFAASGARLKSIASAGGVSGTHIGGKYGFELSTTNSARVCSDPDVNLVVVSTQHNSHASFVIEALRHGKNVFVEKPLCLTLEELEQIRQTYEEAAAKKSVRLMVGFNRRFSPLTVKCREFVKKSDLPCSIIITVNAGSIPADHWAQSMQTGGGRIVGEACHFIDLLRFLTGAEIESISTVLMPAPNAEQATDTATISLGFKNGSIGTVHYFANGNKDFAKERVEIFSAGRILQLDNFKKITTFGGSSKFNQTLWAQDKGQNACASAFVRSIEEGGPCPIAIDEVFEVAHYTIRAAGNS